MLINPQLECATHSTPMGYRGGSLGEYMAHTMTWDGQPMDKRFMLRKQLRCQVIAP